MYRVCIEFTTSTLMQMLQSHWLSYQPLVCSATVWSTKLQCFLVSLNFESTFAKSTVHFARIP